MRPEEWKVKCEFLRWKTSKVEAQGGPVIMRNPVCEKPGAPNYIPDIDSPFQDKCEGCPENKWGKTANS